MKTQICDHYIDLRTVCSIGGLRMSGLDGGSSQGPADQRRYGFLITIAHVYGGTLWLNAAQDLIDGYNLDSTANDAIKAKAKAAYADFVAKWQAVT